MSIYDRLDGGRFGYYNMGEDHEGLPAYSDTSRGGMKDYASNQTTTSGGTEHSQTVTQNVRQSAPVYEQRFIPTERNADYSPWVSAISADPSSRLLNPEDAQRRALANARSNAFVRLAGNLGRMAASDADGTTGPIHLDQSHPMYLQSMSTYRNALPQYNKALATIQASQTKALADLAKAQNNAAMRYDLQDAKGANMAEHTNAKEYNTEARDMANRNAYKVVENDKGYSKSSTVNRTDHSANVQNTSVWKNPSSGGSKNKSFDSLSLTAPYTIRNKDGMQVAATANVNGSDFATLLARISAVADPTNNPAGLPGSPTERQKIRDAAAKWQKRLQPFYDKFGINQNKDIAGEKFYNVYSLSPEQLKNVWDTVGTELLVDIHNLEGYFAPDLGTISMYNDKYKNGISAPGFFNPKNGNIGIRYVKQ